MRSIHVKGHEKTASINVWTFVHVVLAVALVLSVQGASASGRVFFDDFESGGTAKWTFVSNTPATVVSIARDGKRPKGGSRMLEGNWDGVVAWNDPRSRADAQLPIWSYKKEFLIRLWVRFDADVDHRDGSKLLRMGQIGSNMLFIEGQNAQWPASPAKIAFETIAGVTGPISWDGGPIANGDWHKLEIYIKHNDLGAKNGAVKVWTDGVLKINSTGIKSVTDGGNWWPLNLMSNWSSNPGWEHDANNHVYWDDIEIFSDTGTGGVGLMSDATIGVGGSPPAATALPAPTNLR